MWEGGEALGMSKIYVRYLTGSLGLIPVAVAPSFEEAKGDGMVFCYDITDLAWIISMFVAAMRRLDLGDAL